MEENILKKKTKSIRYNTFRFGTIAGTAKGIRFHTAVNSFCLNAAIGEKIKILIDKYFNILAILFFILLIGSVLIIKLI